MIKKNILSLLFVLSILSFKGFSIHTTDSILTSKVSPYSVYVKEANATLRGFKDESGKIIIEPIFKGVYKDLNGQYYVEKPDRACGILDDKGNVVIPVGKYSSIVRCEGVYVCEKYELFGLYDIKGKNLSPNIYSDCNAKNSKRFIGLTLNKYDAVYDCMNQKFLTKYKYPHNDINVSIMDLGIYDSTGNEITRYFYYTGKNENGIVDWYNLTEDKMIDTTYSYVIIDRLTESFRVIKDNKWGLVDIHNNIKIPLVYDELSSVDSKEGFIAVKGKKYGVVDPNNNIITPLIYDGLGSIFSRKTLIAKKDTKFGIISMQNKIITPIEYDYFGRLTVFDSLFIVSKNKKLGLYSFLELKESVHCKYSDIYFYNVYNTDSILVKKGKYYGLINCHDSIVHPFKMKFINKTPVDLFSNKIPEKTFIYKENKKYGIVSTRKIFTPAVYDFIRIDTFGIRDPHYICYKNGVIECYRNSFKNPYVLSGYDDISTIVYQYIVVRKAKKYGILHINDTKELTPVIFDSVSIDRENIVVTKDNKKYNLIFNRDNTYELKIIQ